MRSDRWKESRSAFIAGVDCMGGLVGAAVVLMLVIAASGQTPPPNPRDAIEEARKVMQRTASSGSTNFAKYALTTGSTNLGEYVQQIAHEYDAQHPSDLWLDVLAAKQLKILAKSRPNDLAPRLMLLPTELQDEEECTNWFTTFKEAYSLSTNEIQRATCVALATAGAFPLAGKSIGRTTLAEMDQWVKQLLAQKLEPEVKNKLQFLRLCLALGLEQYADVCVLAEGTPFRTLTPLWMMSKGKGKWEMALKEVRRVQKVPDLSSEERKTMDFFEQMLKELVEKKPDK